jgi:acetyl esterase/lipase
VATRVFRDDDRRALDVFPAPGPAPAPVHVFIHGGYWHRRHSMM